MSRRHTTRREDAAFITDLLAQAHRDWKVGEPVLAQDGTATAIASIDGDIVRFVNGEEWHRSKVRLPR